MSCAQIKVVGEGKGVPGPLVAFPGAYKSDEPGLRVDIQHVTEVCISFWVEM